MKIKARFIGLLMISVLTVATLLPQLEFLSYGDMSTVEATQYKDNSTMYLWERLYSNDEIPKDSKYHTYLFINPETNYYLTTDSAEVKRSGYNRDRGHYFEAKKFDTSLLTSASIGNVWFITKPISGLPKITFGSKIDDDNNDAPMGWVKFPNWELCRHYGLDICTKKKYDNNFMGDAGVGRGILYANINDEWDEQFAIRSVKEFDNCIGVFHEDWNGHSGPGFWADASWYVYIGTEINVHYLPTIKVAEGDTTTIDGNYILPKGATITVPKNASLVVSGVLFNQGKIFVEEGGTLIVKNGGTITQTTMLQMDEEDGNFISSKGTVLVDSGGSIKNRVYRGSSFEGNLSTFGNVTLTNHQSGIFSETTTNFVSSNIINNGNRWNLSIEEEIGFESFGLLSQIK